MLRSLFAGISGLRANQTMLDVTGNNIANANTIGFKGSTTIFQDTLSQMLTGASAVSGRCVPPGPPCRQSSGRRPGSSRPPKTKHAVCQSRNGRVVLSRSSRCRPRAEGSRGRPRPALRAHA